jgi:hypothetical protein
MAKSIPMNTTTQSQLLDKQWHEIMLDWYTRYPREWGQFANKMDHNESYYSKYQMASLGPFAETPEGDVYTADAFEALGGKKVYFPTYKQSVIATEELIDDDLTGIIGRSIIPEMGKSAAYTEELEAITVLSGAFVTTYRVGMDAAALCSATHPIDSPTASTFSNVVSGALSATTLQQGLDICNTMVNYLGVPIPQIPFKLLIDPSNEVKAKELLLSEYKPYSADNEINTLRTNGLTYEVNHYLPAGYWFILCRDHDIKFIWRKKLARRTFVENNTDNIVYTAKMRFGVDFWDWRGVVGSAGA